MAEIEPNWTRRELLRSGALAATGLAFGGVTLSGSTAAEGAETFTFHDDTVLPSGGTCLGEDVELDARGHVVVQEARDGQHSQMHLQVHGDAVGTESGTVYKFSEAVSELYPKGTESFHSRLTSLIVSRGPGPNLFVEWHFHVTTNADGEVTAVKTEPLSFECRG